jgi:hypothetical protein
MRSSVLARIPGFRQRIIPEPRVPSRGSQARGTRLVGCWNAKGINWDINWDESPVPSHANHVRFLVTCYVYQSVCQFKHVEPPQRIAAKFATKLEFIICNQT